MESLVWGVRLFRFSSWAATGETRAARELPFLFIILPIWLLSVNALDRMNSSCNRLPFFLRFNKALKA